MSDLRERPRLVVARVLAVAALLGLGVAIGALAADPRAEPSPRTETQLKRAETVSAERADLLDRSRAALERVGAELDEAQERARSLSRSNARLRHQLHEASTALRRARRSGSG